jgi:acyl-coenzyme A thioesterase PaaI-like protein
MTSPVLQLYNRLAPMPAGRWLFSRLVCIKAPYFASIAPRMESLEPGRGVATLRHRRRVTNHLGSVHAIALCNLAEFVGGLTCDVSIPPGMRWIPKSMSVEYRRRAMGTMRATAAPEFEPVQAEAGYDLPMRVDVVDAAGESVFVARIAMWVSPRQAPTR